MHVKFCHIFRIVIKFSIQYSSHTVSRDIKRCIMSVSNATKHKTPNIHIIAIFSRYKLAVITYHVTYMCVFIVYSTYAKINRCLPDSLSPARCQLTDWLARTVSSHFPQNDILHFAQVKTNVTNKHVKSYERYNIQTFT